MHVHCTVSLKYILKIHRQDFAFFYLQFQFVFTLTMDSVVKSRARYKRLVLMFVCYISNFFWLGEKKNGKENVSILR